MDVIILSDFQMPDIGLCVRLVSYRGMYVSEVKNGQLGLCHRRLGVGLVCVSRALRGGRGKEEPLSAIAMVLQAAPGDDDLPPPGPPRHTSAA